jgi:hypothetical protein
MRPTSCVRLSAAAAGFVLVAAMLIAPAPAKAGDDDDVPLDTKILRGITSARRW